MATKSLMNGHLWEMGCIVSYGRQTGDTCLEKAFLWGGGNCWCGNRGMLLFFFTLLLTKQNVKSFVRSCKEPSFNSLCAGEKTASLGLFTGLRIPLPDPKALPEAKDEWILILGGAGSVGQYTIQVRKNMYSWRWTKNKMLKSQLIFASLPNFVDTRL